MSRRTLLAIGTGVTMAVAGCTGIGADSEPTQPTPQTSTETSDEPTTTERQTETTTQPEWVSEFDEVRDAVEDLGCDPTGESPCDAAIEDGVGENVAIWFPNGRYRFERVHRFEEFDRLGFVGEGEVSFVPPEGFNEKLLNFIVGWVLFKDIDVDISAGDTTAGLRFITDSGFRIENVEFVGRGLHPDGSVVNALALAVRDSSAEGTVREVVAKRGSAIGHYKGGNGRVGIWVGGRHNGHITVEDCHLEEFGNNGIYASRCEGTVSVIGGLFRNNNVSGVRLGGGGNVVRGAFFEIDLDQYTGPDTLTDDDYDTRAIVVEQGPYDLSGRVLIQECDVRMINADVSQGAIAVWTTGNGPRIERTRVVNEVDWVSGIRAMPPESKVSGDERGVEIVDTEVLGTGSGGSGILLHDRPGSSIEGTTIEQRGVLRDGLRLNGSGSCTVTTTEITTTRYPIVVVDPANLEGECFISLSTSAKLGRTGPEIAPLQTTALGGNDSSENATSEDLDGGDFRCIGPSILSGFDTPEAIGIAALEDRTVFWSPHSSLLLPGDTEEEE